MSKVKWYLTIRCDNTVDSPFVSTSGDLGRWADWELRQGQVIEGWEEGAWVRAETRSDGEPDDVLQNHFGLLIFSSPLREALERAGIGRIQYLPIQVLHADGSPIHGFAIANVLDTADVLDLDQSDYDVFDSDYFLETRRGKISGVREAVLRADQLNGHDLLRPANYKVHLYCSERFRDVFERNAFTGFSFRELRLARSS